VALSGGFATSLAARTFIGYFIIATAGRTK